MKREIKFRVWDEIIPKNEGELDNPTGQYVEWDYVKNSCYLIDALNGKYPIEQYTGQENLCEHDIIEITKENDDEHGFYLPVGNKYIIVWDDMYCGFCLASPETFKYNNENDRTQMDLEYYGLVSENLEMPISYYSKLIGNIHEVKS